MNKDDYLRVLSLKKERINYMHQIIKKVKDENIVTSQQLDVLLRGYIILIYSMWESAFKDLHQYFYTGLSNLEINALTYNLKNKILCKLLEKAKKSSSEIRSHLCFERIHREYEEEKMKKVSNLPTSYFAYESNNPTLRMLNEFLGWYNMGINISDTLKKEIEFIIKSRNDIAHSGIRINNLQTLIENEFRESNQTEIDLLQEIVMHIYVLFNDITIDFERLYA